MVWGGVALNPPSKGSMPGPALRGCGLLIPGGAQQTCGHGTWGHILLPRVDSTTSLSSKPDDSMTLVGKTQEKEV